METNKKYICNILRWLDDNIISVLAGFLLVFIPLYPKIPLFDLIPGYIVRARLEDIFIGFTIIIWFIWLIRRKISLKNNPLFKPIAIYLIIGFLSMLAAVFIIQSVPLQILHIQKMVLHFIRRIEYFSLFFILFSAVKSPKYLKLYILILLFTILGVTVYGFGQKYLYWPAFSTMNREFSKGWMLYLTDHSRVLSTFGGHYDLAAFIMMALTILWSLFFALKNKIGKLAIFLLLAGAFWVLILTASRTSFIAYLGAVSVVVILWVFRRNLQWMVLRWVGVMFLSIFIMLSFGDLSDRFTKLLRIDQRLSGLKETLLRPATNPPSDRAIFLVNNLQAVTSKSDQPPTPDKPGARPVDVSEEILLPMPDADNPATYTMTVRTYSKAALQYDLSTGIRLDALWPRAIKGFLANPLLGSGYSTLTKTQQTEFTEAESTDNDYLRMLGETGLLGTFAFLGIIAVGVITIWKSLSGIRNPLFYSILVGVIGLTFGLLLNAIYIDVFEASKVAYSYWAIMGLTLGAINVSKTEIEKNRRPLVVSFDFCKFKQSFLEGITSDRFLLILILIGAFYLRLYKIDSPIADWHSWRQADTAAVTRNFERNGINFLYPTFDDLSSIPSGKPNPKGLRMVEFPIYNATSVVVKKLIPEGPLERSMRLTSIFASLGSIVFLFLLTRKYLSKRIAFITSIIYSILPYNIFYNRAVLPEPFLVFLSLGTIYFFDRYLLSLQENQELINKIKFFVLTLLFGSFSLLVKPTAGFLMVCLIYLSFRYFSYKLLFKKSLYLLAFLIIIPFILWRIWINQFPEGIPAYSWLLNGDNIRFKGAFFQWIFADRLARLILGFWGLPLLILGLLAKTKEKEGWLFRWLGIGSLVYLFVFATGNVRHDYYQILIIPAVTIFVAKGIDFLLSVKEINRFMAVTVLIVSVLFMEAFGWYQIRDFFNINHPEIVQAGKAVDQKVKTKALVIAPYGGDTAFLYQTGRSGWPIVESSIEYLIAHGANYYVSVTFDDLTNKMIKIAQTPSNLEGYKIVEKADNYVIIQIVPDSKLPKN